MATAESHTQQFDGGRNARCSSSSSSYKTASQEIGAQREPSVSDLDLESGELHFSNRIGRDCRICHLSLEGSTATAGEEEDNGAAIELGCCCKGDLSSAHRKCAEAWFKIKGNTTCEICGATALSIAAEQTNEVVSANVATSTTAPAAPVIFVETQTFWHSRRVMNFLLACMVFAFIISWLFHFKVLA